MAVGRVKRNLWRESWVGAIATLGDPLARRGSWLAGADFTYATSQFRGDKNLLVGVWGLATGREDLGRDATAHGVQDRLSERSLGHSGRRTKRIGRDFDPSLGFVPRPAVYLSNLEINSSPRLAHGPIQQMFFEFEPSLATDLSGRWESYRVFCAPVNWRFRSGDRFEFNVNPTGERLWIRSRSHGVTITPGAYHWRQYRLEAGTAQKRRLYTELTWWFGGFYNGDLDQLRVDRRMESRAARHAGVHWRARYRRAADRQLQSNPGRQPSATQHLTGPVRSRATCSTTRRATRSAPTRASAGPSSRRLTSSSSTTTICARLRIAGSSTPTSCWSNCSTRFATSAERVGFLWIESSAGYMRLWGSPGRIRTCGLCRAEGEGRQEPSAFGRPERPQIAVPPNTAEERVVIRCIIGTDRSGYRRRR